MNADLIAKIQKLRALAASTNVHEAANAAAAAERLIAEHQLSEADLGAHTTEAAEAVESLGRLFAHDSERRAYWKEWLADGLARLYGCALNCTWLRVEVKTDTFPYNGAARRVGFTVIGTKSDVELLRYQFAYLSTEIERLAQRFLASNTFARGEAKTAANSFRVGAEEGVLDAMFRAREAQVEKHSAEAGNANAALVLVGRRDAAVALDRKLNPSKYKTNGKRRSGGSVTANTNHAAREAGRRAGAGLHNSGALPGGATRQLGK